MRRILLFTFLIISFRCLPQSWQDTVALIEKTMSRYAPQNPGCQLSIKRNGKIIYSKAWGMADLEHSIPLTTMSIIEAGSVSKQFTAAAILLLEQQGKLSLNDDVRKYLPELRDYGAVITLEQMMHHTSGLRDWGSVAQLAGWPRTTKTYTNDDALEIIAAQKKLNNIPGAEFIYSNSNYNLLAIIVQRVSGQSLAEFTKENIFIPAGMTHTQWRDNHKRIVTNRAIAYAFTKNGYETEMPNEDVYGNGGLLTTTEDLLKWNDFYLGEKLGTASLLYRQTKVVAFNNGFLNNYGAGLFIQKINGWKNISHTGATAAYRANLETFPELDLSIAFLSNTSRFDTAKININSAIRNIFVTDKEEKQTTKNITGIPVPEARLTAYTGWYKNDRDGSGIRITLNDKKLALNNAILIPQTESRFTMAAGNGLITINNAGDLFFIIPGRDTIHYLKAEPAILLADNLNTYEGTYFSTETNSSLIVYQQEGRLMIHIKPDEDHPLTPTYKDAFAITDWGGNLYFVKNKENKVVALKISIPRAENVVFEKIK